MKPEIRFNGFSDEWVEKKLDQSKIRIATGKLNANAATINGKYPFFTTAIETYMTDSYSFDDDAILIAGNGNLGFVKEYNGKFDAYQREYVLTNFEGYAKSYLVSYFKHLLGEHISHSSKGSAMPYITKDILESFLIASPSLPEQQKIGALFSKYDTIIGMREQKLAELNALKKGLLQQMFPKTGAKVPELRFKGFADEWVERKLGELASFSKGNGYTKNDLIGSGDPIVLYGRLYTKYEIVIENVDTFVKKKDNSIVSEGYEVVVPASGETSEDISRASAIIASGLILGGDLNIIKPVNDIDSIFLALTISNGPQQKELSKRAQGKSIVHLHNADLKQVNLLYPKFDEQQKIGQLFKHLDERISNEQTKIEQLKVQKQGLLQRML